jgi:hypothetical protein
MGTTLAFGASLASPLGPLSGRWPHAVRREGHVWRMETQRGRVRVRDKARPFSGLSQAEHRAITGLTRLRLSGKVLRGK